jgi:nucleoside-diphosphate-sugar epimerase
MKILVTGCSGYVGRAAVAHLLADGHEIRGVDLVDPGINEIEFQSVDLFEVDALRKSFVGMDAILHLAGIPSPSVAAEKVFALNCSGTFNVYAAAAACDIHRVVVASSIHAIGYFFGLKPFELSHLPVDEAHPKFTTDSYSFSKQIAEDIGDYFWRRNEISSVSLRFGAGWHSPHLTRREEIDTLLLARAHLDDLTALPIDEAIRSIAKSQTKFDALRTSGVFEASLSHPRSLNTAELRLIWMRHTMFSYVDLGDACEAMALGLTHAYAGSHPLFVVNSENILGFDAAKLAQLFYPAVKLNSPIQGTQSFLNGKNAEAILGFRAKTPPSQLLVE